MLNISRSNDTIMT